MKDNFSIEIATFKDVPELQETRFAPYVGYTCYIIDDEVLLFEGQIITDFDVISNQDLFDITERYDHEI